MMHSMGMPTQAFQIHAALALQLIALVSGILLINKAHTTEFFCKKTGKIVGGFVAIVAILSMLCIGYLGIKRCCSAGRGMKPPMPAVPSDWKHPPMDMPTGMPLDHPAAPK